MPEFITLNLHDLLGGLISVAAAVVLLARGLRTPAQLRRVFAALAAVVACTGLILVFRSPIVDWIAVSIGVVAVLALINWLPAAAKDISNH